MNRVDRLTGTILLLQTRPGISLGDLAAHWEISERTVFRDLAALAEMGVPIATGEGGGYRLVGSFSLPPILLNEDEAAAMAIAVAATEEIADVSLRRSLRSGLAKVQAVLPSERQAELKQWREVVGVWLVPGGPPQNEDVLLIRRAILGKNCITFTYFTGGTQPGCERIVEPMGLLYYAGHWHLLAHCRLRHDFRDFRLDRMTRVTETGETFVAHEAFSIRTHLAREMAKAEAFAATVKVRARAVERFRRGLVGAVKAETPWAEGGQCLDVAVPCLEGMAAWLLSFGADVEVVSPPTLRAHLRDAARAVGALYESS